MEPTPCFSCDKQLTAAVPNSEIGQPYQGLLFTARGNYGSTIFDPAISSRVALQVVICDECVISASKTGKVLRITTIPRIPDITLEAWEYGKYDD